MAADGGVIAHLKDGVVVAGSEASFRGEVSDICGVWPPVRGDVVAELMGYELGAAKLNVSANRVT